MVSHVYGYNKEFCESLFAEVFVFNVIDINDICVSMLPCCRITVIEGVLDSTSYFYDLGQKPLTLVYMYLAECLYPSIQNDILLLLVNVVLYQFCKKKIQMRCYFFIIFV